MTFQIFIRGSIPTTLLLIGGSAAGAANDTQSVPAAVSAALPQQQVTVAGRRLNQRQNETTMTIVIAHEEIMRQGDRSLTDVLKRLPSVVIGGAPGEAAEIRLRGMGKGYTQVLLNGLPAPVGFSVDSIAPEVIERIEIMRTGTAEYSAQAIAGTINIVLRKSTQPAQRESTLSLGHSQGRVSPSLATLISDGSGNLKYTVSASLARDRFENAIVGEERRQEPEGGVTLLRRTPHDAHGYADILNLSGRLNWALSDHDTITWQNFVNAGRRDKWGFERETVLVGTATEYPNNDYGFFVRTVMGRSDLTWERRLPNSDKFEVQLSALYNKRDYNHDFLGFGNVTTGQTHNLVTATSDDMSYNVKGKYSASLWNSHALGLGWDGVYNPRDESRLERKLGTAPGQPPSDVILDNVYDAVIKRLAVYLQDEWAVTTRASVYMGLRWEVLTTVGGGSATAAVHNRSSVVSPLLQSLWKFSEGHQVRFGVARTYKAPSMADLIPRMTTVDNNNTPTNANWQGNPNLRPELTWGLDVAYEYYFGKDSMLSVNAYERRIDDVIVRQLILDQQTWILRPDNAGSASATGIELEAKFSLPSLYAAAPPANVRFNLTRNWSRIDMIPGPNNRLEQQAPLTANLGLDYRVQKVPITIGGNYQFQKNGRTKLPSNLASYVSPKRALDVYMVWAYSDKTRLRLAATNLLHRDNITWSEYSGDAFQLRNTLTARTASAVRVALEHKY